MKFHGEKYMDEYQYPEYQNNMDEYQYSENQCNQYPSFTQRVNMLY